MKVSVITVCLNSELTIGRNLDSVSNQTFDNIEHVIIDGGSFDDTIRLIESKRSSKLVFLSEADNGIYDAMNKGISLATGDVICFLNSDDIFREPNSVEKIVEQFAFADVICSGVNYIDGSGVLTRTWLPTDYSAQSYADGWHTPHPGFWCSAHLCKSVSGFDSNFKIAADFDWMLRIMLNSEKGIAIFKEVTVSMNPYGISSKFNMRIQGFLELMKIYRKNRIPITFLKLIRVRYLPKIIGNFL